MISPGPLDWSVESLTRTRLRIDDPPRLRRVVGLCGVLVWLATVLVACTGSSPAKSQAPTLADARHVLLSCAAAVVVGNEQRLLADIDPQSTRFRAQQRTDVASLRRIPLRTWRYGIVGVIRDPAANRAAARRYATPVLLVHVTLFYALRGVDPVPDRHDQYLVFTERAGHTYLAGDDALAGETITSWVGPW